MESGSALCEIRELSRFQFWGHRRLSLWQPLMPPVSWIGVCFVLVDHSPSETKKYHPSTTQITQLYALLSAHWTNSCRSLRWRHSYHDGVSNHQPHGCLLNRLFMRRSKKTSKLRVTGLCAGNSRWPVNSPHKGPVTRKMFPFDDVIMYIEYLYPGNPSNFAF